MKHRLLALLYRLVILCFGLLLAYLVAFTVFPYLDRRFPLLVAILATYCLVAYGGLPTLVRIWQLLQRPTHVPTRTHAADGWAVDPINIVVVAKNETQFKRAMAKAGWLPADPHSIKNDLHFMYALLLNRPYPTGPFGNQYVFGRKQDLGFQIPIGNSIRRRHHVRFWKLGVAKIETADNQKFWQKLLHRFVATEKEIWIGAATLDQGITIHMRNLQLDHSIESNTVLERDFLVETLRKINAIKDVVEIKAGEPLHTRHQGFGEIIISDGYVKLCELKRQFLPRKP